MDTIPDKVCLQIEATLSWQPDIDYKTGGDIRKLTLE
jgi:hypothetical protein